MPIVEDLYAIDKNLLYGVTMPSGGVGGDGTILVRY